MATKKAPSTNTAPEAKTRVTRIRASETNTTKAAPSKKPAAITTEAKPKKARSIRGAGKPFVAIGRYFKGAWQELREVRWPDRRATWGMTGALLGFTAFVVALVLLLDALFKYIFELILQ